MSSQFFVPASESRNVSGSTHLLLTYAHGTCASSCRDFFFFFLAEAPSLISKAEVSGPEAGRPKGTSSWAMVPLGWNSSFWTRRSQGCLAEELPLPRFPHLLSTSLLCGQVSARPLYLIALWKSGGTMPPTELGMDTCAFYCQPDVMFSIYVGQKNKKNKDGSPSCFLSTCEASTALRAPPD